MNRLNSKKSAFEIAVASTEDCSECARLLVEQLAEHGVDASTGSLTKVLNNVVDEPARGFLLTARATGQIVGVAYVALIPSAEHCGNVAWLEELYVVPAQRRHGIGGALIKAVMERARKLGVVAIDLEIDEAHARAAALYQRLGFQPLKRSRWVKRLDE